MHSPPDSIVSSEARARKYREKYAHGVIIRDNDLSAYNQFLHNLGENKTLLEIVRTILQRKKSCRILDVGCGNANALHELKQHAGAGVHTIGIDLLPLEHASYVDAFIQGDVHESPIPGECDLILSFRALHEMGDLSTLLLRFAAALAPAGRAYLWIRMREYANGGPVFVGEMNILEEKTLLALEEKPVLDGCKIMVHPVMQRMEGGSRAQSFVAGYAVLLFRPSA